MLIYFSIYTLIFFITLLPQKSHKIFSWIISFFLCFFIGFRDEIGGDWKDYIRMYDAIILLPFPLNFLSTDIGYATFNIMSSYFDWGIYGVNFLCAILFVTGVFKISKVTPNATLSFLAIIPYMGFVVAMGYTRQGVALGIVFWAVSCLLKNKIKSFILLCLLASLFHFSAVISITFLIIVLRLKSWKTMFFLLSLIPIVFFAIDKIGSRISIYTGVGEEKVESGGAAIRLGINFIFSILFFIFYKTFKKRNSFLTKLLLYCSIMSIILFFLSFKLSTIADRMGLYFSILQPLFISYTYHYIKNDQKIFFNLSAYLFYLIFLYSWFSLSYYATNFWTPYKNILL